MADPRVPLKNPILAVVLGLLFPGAGQLYQGRTFKGILYAVCIVGTFTYGMFLSDWTALYAGSPATGRRWGYLAQTPIGVPAAYALIQKNRYIAPSNVPQSALDESISAPFRGVVRFGDDDRGLPPGTTLPEPVQEALDSWQKATDERRDAQAPEFESEGNGKAYAISVSGQIELRPISTYLGPAVEGRFAGHMMLYNPETQAFDIQDKPIEFQLNSVVGRFEIARKIYADRDRPLRIDVVAEGNQDRPQKIGVLLGAIPRPVGDWFAVPLESEKLGRLHFELGKTYDLALVYTWVAALLNVLVLWDAYEGPAYGYGDEEPGDDPDSPRSGKAGGTADKTASAAEPKQPAEPPA